MLSRENSKLLSDAVQRGIVWLFGGEASGEAGSLPIRKIAHFVEFAFLGGVAAMFFRERKVGFLKAFLFSAAVAALDETIQIFSHRGSSFSDVILDSCGAAFGVFAAFLILMLLKKISNYKQQ